MSKQVLTKRENSAVQRVAYMRAVASVIEGFVNKGFGTLQAVLTIAKQYGSELTYDEVYNFWNFRRQDADVLSEMETVLEKLKSE